MKQPATGVPIAQAYAPSVPPQGQVVGQFSTGLCDCLSDCSVCCLTCWCPCITFGRIAETVDRGLSSCGASGALYTCVMCCSGCQWIYSHTYRTKLKALYGMEDNCFGDCCTHFCCEPCALCQEYRELQHRGYDPALGWHGNMEKQNPGMRPPPMASAMTR